MASPVHSVMETMKPAGDILSIGVVLATLASWLPSIAAIFTIIWTAIRIYETRTVQSLLGRAKT
jgi:chromate transport protein ChrA